MPATLLETRKEPRTLDTDADRVGFLADLPGCQAVAHVDLGARTVLRAETRPRLPQEFLDSLCTWAAEVLGTDRRLAIALDDTAMRVAIRLGGASLPVSGEALCLLLPPGSDPALVLARLERETPG